MIFNVVRRKWILPLGLIFLCSLFSQAQADTLYSKKSGTKVYAEPSARSKVVDRLNAGAELKSGEAKGKFIQVTPTSGRKGWVFKFKVADQAPSKDTKGLSSLGREKMAAKESTSSSSIRGLSAVSEKHAEKKGVSKADIDAVKAMESFSVSAQEVDRFLSNRKLGEYQE